MEGWGPQGPWEDALAHIAVWPLSYIPFQQESLLSPLQALPGATLDQGALVVSQGLLQRECIK